MKTNRDIIICVLIFLLLSCNSNDKQDNGISFKEEYSIRHTTYDTELLIKQGRIAVSDSLLILVSNQQDPFCKVYSIRQNMKEICSYGRIGNGPDEFIQPLLTYSYKNNFGLNDINKKELAIMQIVNENNEISIIESIRLKADTKKGKENVFRTDYYFTRLNSEHYVSLLYEGENNFFSLFDSTLTLKCRFGESPISEEISPIVAVNRLQGRIAASNGKMIFATSYLPYLVCYHLKNNTMEKKWSFFYKKAYYGIKNGELLFDKNRSYGQVINLKTNSQFIYLLYLDQLLSDFDFYKTEKSLANVILVFDYDGNAVAKLNLSCRISEMAISKDGEKIYGIAHLPEPILVEFILPKMKN